MKGLQNQRILDPLAVMHRRALRDIRRRNLAKYRDEQWKALNAAERAQEVTRRMFTTPQRRAYLASRNHKAHAELNRVLKEIMDRQDAKAAGN